MVNKFGLVCGLIALGACSKDFDQQVAGRTVVEARISAAPTSVAPPGTLERRVLDLASCQLEGYQIVDTCSAMRALRQELAVSGGSKELSLSLARASCATPPRRSGSKRRS